MNGPAVVVDGLTKRFRDVVALDKINFEVEAGTVFGLLGPNGAGKTTAVRILATLIRPDEGIARVLGRDVVKDARAVRYLIGLAGQSATVDSNLTGYENLRLIGKLAHLPRSQIPSRAEELLERFELTGAAGRPVRTYSGGMRRRLDVAAALVQRPPVLFLDEPTTGLDLHSRNELWAMIKELVAEGSTVLLTTQYLEEADRLANRVAVVDQGRVIANDAPSALKARLGSTVIELGMTNQRSATAASKLLTRLAGGRLERDELTLRLVTENAPHMLIEVLRVLDGKKLTPSTLAVREPSLDDVFLALTGRRAVATNESEETATGEA